MKNGVTRQALATFIAIMGGFTAAIIRVTNLFLGNYQGFVLTKSMVKKLYTRKDTARDSSLGSRMNQFGDKTSQLSLTSEQNDVIQSILARKKIKYNDFTQLLYKLLSPINLCFSCCRSCFGRDKLIPPPAGEQDWALASRMLVQETDILDIL